MQCSSGRAPRPPARLPLEHAIVDDPQRGVFKQLRQAAWGPGQAARAVPTFGATTTAGRAHARRRAPHQRAGTASPRATPQCASFILQPSPDRYLVSKTPPGNQAPTSAWYSSQLPGSSCKGQQPGGVAEAARCADAAREQRAPAAGGRGGGAPVPPPPHPSARPKLASVRAARPVQHPWPPSQPSRPPEQSCAGSRRGQTTGCAPRTACRCHASLP